MSAMLTRREMVMALMPATTAVPPFQLFIIALTAFLTVVDLFATQALLPTLTAHYQVTAGRNGTCGQCLHTRHGDRRPERSRSLAIASTGALEFW